MRPADFDAFSTAARVLSSAPLAAAFAAIAVATAFGEHLITSLIGVPGFSAMLVGLATIGTGILLARLPIIEWRGLLPISVLLFLAWSAVSVVWSATPLATVPAVGGQLAWAFIAIVIALTRDTIQIVRATGSAFRALLGTSLALEVLSGVLIDTPLPFLGISGNLAFGGPLEGVFGTRSALGIAALLGLVTFVVEWRTRSVRHGVTIGSIALAAGLILGTRSPSIALLAAALGIATAVLYVFRQLRPEPRRTWQFVLLAVLALVGLIGYLFRSEVFRALGLGLEIEQRYALWQETLRRLAPSELNGWGWTGGWVSDAVPYRFIDASLGRTNDSALNAYLDVYLQLGLIGLALFLLLAGLALVRTWLIATNRRSVVHVWAALIVVTLLASGAAESSLLLSGGWLLLVVCAVIGAGGLSWRRKLPER
ncbi:O-antigen ligase [Plantibacter flavus]|uniref:O-antigen ligase n=1 Tax=Plantibacter flavus TaxID=150123 RepID=A0A3N2C4G2_9MICO|nr:O-antigen ligase family protein [Plantibacter flavus]ROR82418.1 O-antigen ligase [Plantibacter flavus]SMG43987.1 O-antigen ligase [Plantibacter flavus]